MRRQRLQFTKRAIGPLRSVHNHYSTRDHRHRQPHANQRLSTHSPHITAQIRAEQLQPPKQEQPSVDKEIPTERSTPVDTPTESPDTQATDTVVASSPEPACETGQEVDLFAADIPTLQNLQRAASEKVTYHETRLARACQNLWRITKRLKTIQDGQEPDTPQASPIVDIEMEIID